MTFFKHQGLKKYAFLCYFVILQKMVRAEISHLQTCLVSIMGVASDCERAIFFLKKEVLLNFNKSEQSFFIIKQSVNQSGQSTWIF